MTTQTLASAMAATLRPLRLNFAQVCIWCGYRWCASPRCVGLHERSVWIVCIDCDGFGVLGPLDACHCVHGLMEATPAVDPAELRRPLPVYRPEDDEPAFMVTPRPAGQP